MKNKIVMAGTITAWSIAIIITLYLILGFLILPLLAPMIINKQASKITGHHVSLKSMKLNPLTLTMSLADLIITDNNQQKILGFDRFTINIATLKLLQGIYLIQHITINGLQINAVLMANNQLNLMQLIPRTDNEESPESTSEASPTLDPIQSADVSSTQSPTKLVINEINLKRCAISFSDQAIGKDFAVHCDPLDLLITGFSTEPNSQVNVKLNSVIDGQGKLIIEALAKPFSPGYDLDAVITLSDYAMQAITPYVGKYTGRAVKDGSHLDLQLTYKIKNQNLDAKHQVQIKDFQLGNKVISPKALALPFDLIVALVKNQQGHIDISLPVTGNINDPKFGYLPLLGKVGMDFLLNIATSPFKTLISLLPVGDSFGLDKQEIDIIYFTPNSADITEIEKKKLDLIAKAFKKRSLLAMIISGTYDPNVDGQAVKQPAEAKQTALTKLAEKRSMVVYQTLKTLGIKSGRLKRSGIRAVHENKDKVPLKLKLATR